MTGVTCHADRRPRFPHPRGLLLDGYRRVLAALRLTAPCGGPGFDRERLIAVKSYFAQRQIRPISRQSARRRASISSPLAMACPFAPSEKQALLEAADPDERAQLLMTLVEMAAIEPTGEESGGGGTRH
jgi:hypothetical protein